MWKEGYKVWEILGSGVNISYFEEIEVYRKESDHEFNLLHIKNIFLSDYSSHPKILFWAGGKDEGFGGK